MKTNLFFKRILLMAHTNIADIAFKYLYTLDDATVVFSVFIVVVHRRFSLVFYHFANIGNAFAACL